MNEPNAPATFQLPEQMSTVSGDVDWLYYFIYWMSVVLFVAIVGAMIYWAIKYRERKGHKAEPTGHNMPLEIAWTVAPIFVLVFLFHKGFQGYSTMTVAPANSMEVRVNAKQWGWEFVYPNGGTDNELHVPDPQTRKARHVVGRRHPLVLHPGDARQARRRPGHVHLRLVRGDAHGAGRHLLRRVLRRPEQGLRRQRASVRANDGTLVDALHRACRERRRLREIPRRHRRQMRCVHPQGPSCPENVLVAQGQQIYTKKACMGCHTTNGARLVGPSWKGIWGRTELTDHGPVKVDESYIRESILDPQAKIVAGFRPTMPPFRGQITDPEIDEVIAFMKSLKE